MNKQHTAYDISAPQVIAPTSPLNPLTGLVGYITQTAGSAGNLVFNDCETLEEASIENQILNLAYNQTLGGAIGPGSALDLPIETGLVVSEVPTGMVLSVVYSVYVVG